MSEIHPRAWAGEDAPPAKPPKHDDGGPAFPVQEVRGSDGCGIMEGANGMSLRDWFAGQALAGLVVCETTVPPRAATATQAYEFADAMLAERAKR